MGGVSIAITSRKTEAVALVISEHAVWHKLLIVDYIPATESPPGNLPTIILSEVLKPNKAIQDLRITEKEKRRKTRTLESISLYCFYF